MSASGRSHARAVEFALFVAVGALGFATDLCATMFFVHGVGLSPMAARLLAIPLAVAVTFGLNRALTFRSRQPGVLAQAARYALVSAAGASVNFAVYEIYLNALGAPAAASISVAVALGSAAALLVNYTGSRLFAFGE